MQTCTDECVPAVWRQRPFVGETRCRTLDASLRLPTIAEIVADIPKCDLPRGFSELGEARINGDLVPREMWPLVRPRYRPGRDTIVSLHVPLHGPSGGGAGAGSGGKSTLALVASIAVLLVAAAASGGAFGFESIGLLSAQAVNAIAGAGIGRSGKVGLSVLRKRR